MQFKTIQIDLRGAAVTLPCGRICHRWTLLRVTPSFQFGKNFKNRKKHQSSRSAWVGQADFGKLELNNIRNHRGNSQSINVAFRPSPFRGQTRLLLSFAILRLLRNHSNKQTFHCGDRESWKA